MTLKVEKVSNGPITTIRLIGRMGREHLEELKAQINHSGPKVALDLNEVSLVGVDVVHFLGTCQIEGVKLVHCSPYIRDRIAKERQSQGCDLSRPRGVSAEIRWKEAQVKWRPSE